MRCLVLNGGAKRGKVVYGQVGLGGDLLGGVRPCRVRQGNFWFGEAR